MVVVDDDAHMRAALQEVVDAQPDLAWVGDTDNADAAADACRSAQADVVVIDVRIPGGGDVAATQIRRHCPEVALVAFSAFSDTVHRDRMAAVGVTRYVVKGEPVTQLLAAIRSAAKGG